MDYNLSRSITSFFSMLFACTLEFLLNQSKGDGMSNHWLVKLFIIVTKCWSIAHFHVIVICVWLQFLVDCCNFIHYNVCNEKLASNLLLLLLLLWWLFYFCEHNGELYINKMIFFFIQSYLGTLKMIRSFVNGFTPKLPRVVNEGYHNLPLSCMRGFSSFS